jgi:hypothetical protein
MSTHKAYGAQSLPSHLAPTLLAAAVYAISTVYASSVTATNALYALPPLLSLDKRVLSR